MTEIDWVEISRGPEYEQFCQLWTRQYGAPLQNGINAPPRWFLAEGQDGRPPMKALMGRELRTQGAAPRWHISVSTLDRPPTWEEMVATVHKLRPGVPFVMGIPPLSWWMNIHPHALHAWESFDQLLIDEWRDNARGDRPS